MSISSTSYAFFKFYVQNIMLRLFRILFQCFVPDHMLVPGSAYIHVHNKFKIATRIFIIKYLHHAFQIAIYRILAVPVPISIEFIEMEVMAADTGKDCAVKTYLFYNF